MSDQVPDDDGFGGATDVPRTRQSGERLAPDRRMLDSLVCPVTQHPLEYDRDAGELISRQARLAFPIRDGIPIMLVGEARHLDD